jgi:Domain of unknown function (DUF5047)
VRPATARFLQAAAASHHVVTTVQVRPPTADAFTVNTAVDGTVNLDARAATRGRLDLTLIDDGTVGLVPMVATDPLAPYGTELQVSRGIRYPDSTVELVSLGVFRIDDSDINETAGGAEIKITGLDRSARIIDARFAEPYQIAAGTNYGTAILSLIQDAYPDVPYNASDFTSVSDVTPQLIAEEGDDRWALAQSMATSLGRDLYFDGDGTLRLVPSSIVGSTAPVADLVEGDGGVLVGVGRRWSRQGAYNAWIVTGENTGEDLPIPRGVAIDNNPASPTYYYGAFGQVPGFYSSQLITSDAQAQDAAVAMLAKQLGTTQSVSFGSIVNPALEPGDVAQIRRRLLGIDEAHVIDTLSVPLSAAGAMAGTTRAVQVTT